jgi:1,3-beta-glucanosyltransferase GAS3
MSIFNAAGIYVLLDVNTPQEAINRDEPYTTYDMDYLNFIFSQVENFKGYPNLLGFFAGNEIINDNPSAGIDPPYIRVGLSIINCSCTNHRRLSSET